MSDETGLPEGWKMVMRFIDPSEPHVLGFEIGTIWGFCNCSHLPVQVLVHTKNLPQLELMAEHFNCDMFVDPVDPENEWSKITFTVRPIKKSEPKLRLV